MTPANLSSEVKDLHLISLNSSLNKLEESEMSVAKVIKR